MNSNLMPSDVQYPAEMMSSETNVLPDAEQSISSQTISIDDVEELKSIKWSHEGGINEKDTVDDKRLNAAFGDHPPPDRD